MGRHRSFRSSDLRLRDVPGFFAIYLVISVVCVVVGVALEALPELWRGLVAGVGLGFAGGLLLLGRGRKDKSAQTEA
jgi:hypothetical protein